MFLILEWSLAVLFSKGGIRSTKISSAREMTVQEPRLREWSIHGSLPNNNFLKSIFTWSVRVTWWSSLDQNEIKITFTKWRETIIYSRSSPNRHSRLVSGQLYLWQDSVWTLAHTIQTMCIKHYRKQPALVVDTFPASRGCLLTGASTVFQKISWDGESFS